MISRRQFLSALAAGATVPFSTSSWASANPVQEIIAKFDSVKTISGGFVQFEPRGSQSEGSFGISRPGKAVFDYSGGGLKMISDGRSVGINNRKLGTWDLYPLSKTPLKLLLGTGIDLRPLIKLSKEGSSTISFLMADKQALGDFTVEMVFDKESHELRQWTTVDQRGLETTVVVYDVAFNKPLPASLFRIPYGEIRTLK